MVTGSDNDDDDDFKGLQMKIVIYDGAMISIYKVKHI